MVEKALYNVFLKKNYQRYFKIAPSQNWPFINDPKNHLAFCKKVEMKPSFDFDGFPSKIDERSHA